MRILILGLIFMSAAFNCGCKNLFGKSDRPDAPKATGKIPERSAKDLVEYLNRQASYLDSISYTNVSVHTSEAGRDNPRLGDSSLHAQKPKNFRLIGGTFATSGEVDLGSNDREFWMYVKRMDDPNFFYCSHEEFARGAARKFPIPFDTEWVMQAIGLASYPADAEYAVSINEQQRKYVLTTRTTTAAGIPVKRTILFNADQDGGRKPVVSKHLIANERDQTLASAEIVSAKVLNVGGKYVQVPTEVILEWPQQKFVMRLVLDGERVNEDFKDRGVALFSRPQIRGANPIDLATYRFNPTVRSQAPSRK